MTLAYYFKNFVIEITPHGVYTIDQSNKKIKHTDEEEAKQFINLKSN